MQEKTVPCGIALRTKWMQCFLPLRDAAQDAYNEWHEIANPQKAHNADGMPHANGKSDPTAACCERSEKAWQRFLEADKAAAAALRHRKDAMRNLDKDQQEVLELVFLRGFSRRETAKLLGRSDFWVRAKERTGLFMLELPNDWYEEIIP